jgi:hypothetical protein
MGMQKATRDFTQWSGRRYKQFYDRAAFIATNVPIGENPSFPGVNWPFPPYLGSVEIWQHAETTGTVDCESVGTVYLVPAEVYRRGDPLFRPNPTAFTEHFPVVHAAKSVIRRSPPTWTIALLCRL